MYIGSRKRVLSKTTQTLHEHYPISMSSLWPLTADSVVPSPPPSSTPSTSTSNVSYTTTAPYAGRIAEDFLVCSLSYAGNQTPADRCALHQVKYCLVCTPIEARTGSKFCSRCRLKRPVTKAPYLCATCDPKVSS